MSADQSTFDEAFAEAKTAHQSGDLKTAVPIYQALTKSFPEQAEPYHMLALVASQSGRFETAIDLYKNAIQRNSQNVLYRNNLAEALQRIGREKEAVELLKETLEMEPNFDLGKFKLACILKKIKNFQHAEHLFQEVIVATPDFAQAYFQFGTLKLETGFFQSAKELLIKANELAPHSVMTLNNLGVVHQELDDPTQAIKFYQLAIDVDAKYTDAIRNLALIHDKVGNAEEAKDNFTKLAQIKNDPLVFWNAALVSPKVFDSKEHIANYRNLILNELEKIKQQKFKLDVEQLVKTDILPPSDIIYHGEDDLPIKKAYAELFKGIPKLKLSEEKNEKTRVGFVVTAGHEGVFTKCMMGMINQLSPDKLEVYVICSFPNGPKILQKHLTHPRVKLVGLPKSIGASVKMLISLNFDVLHYWEVGTDAYNYFLPFFKPAKVQCTSWGWPVTSGNPNIDYFISSKGLDEPESQAGYSEKLVLFEKLPVYYARPKPHELFKTKQDFGLSSKNKLYLCTQNVRKIHPDFESTLNGILTKDKQALIVFLGDNYSALNQRLENRFQKQTQKNIERIMILPRLNEQDYFNILQLADVILDTTHYTGGANTNYDAFALGAPVVTVPSSFHRGKFTAAAYQQMGIHELIANSTEDYVEKAIRVANDAKFRDEIKTKILANAEKLFEDDEAVRELEQFFLTITES